ncbi:MAG: hypothetical protein IJ123_07330 [Blautia sp.]|nr:hypothetical protein [Blautia sp.]
MSELFVLLQNHERSFGRTMLNSTDQADFGIITEELINTVTYTFIYDLTHFIIKHNKTPFIILGRCNVL